VCKYLVKYHLSIESGALPAGQRRKKKIKKKKCGFIKIPSLFSFLSYFLFAKLSLLQGRGVSSLACS
jgi:hypothetical protein